METKNSPSTLVIKLQDKFKVLREVRELRPSILEMQLDERSKCRRCQAEVRPSILGMWLQWRLRDVTVGLRWTSSKLDRERQIETTNSPSKKNLDHFVLRLNCATGIKIYITIWGIFFSINQFIVYPTESPRIWETFHQRFWELRLTSSSSNVLICLINSPKPKTFSSHEYKPQRGNTRN